jgi:hypothetical protein
MKGVDIMAKKNTEKEKAILKNMETLGLTREEAEELYAFDNDEVGNDEVDAIEEKAEKEKKPKGSSLDKVKLMKAKKKADAEKEKLIQDIFGFVKGLEVVQTSTEVTGTKLSLKTKDGNFYSVTVTKHKSRPDGLKEE